MITIVKKVVIRYLARSGNPQLQELAKWLKDAEDQAVNRVLDFLEKSLKSSGTIDADAAAKMLEVRNSPGTANPDAAREQLRLSSPFLAEYREIFNTLSKLAAWRKALYVRGFVDTADCTTIWRFPKGTAPAFDVAVEPSSGRRYIPTFASGVLEVYRIGALTPEALKAANESIGNNYELWNLSVEWQKLDRIDAVYEDAMELSVAVKKEKKKRHGAAGDEFDRELKSVPIKVRDAGVDSMLETLPVALEDRDASLTALRKKTSE